MADGVHKESQQSQLQGKVESGLKGGGLVMRTTASIRHSNMEKYPGASLKCLSSHALTVISGPYK